MKGWRALGGLAVLAALCACDGEPREGVYRYGCYTGPLADTYLTVTWSDAGRRADAVIDGRAYVFREAGGGGGFFDFIEVYKDGGATLSIDPELVFTPAEGEHSMCNPGERVK